MSDEVAPVENEDVATFSAKFDSGAVGTFSASRVAHNLPDGLGFELFAYQTRAFLDQIAGIDHLGPLPGFEAGLHGLRAVAAVTESAQFGGAAVKVL